MCESTKSSLVSGLEMRIDMTEHSPGHVPQQRFSLLERKFFELKCAQMQASGQLQRPVSPYVPQDILVPKKLPPGSDGSSAWFLDWGILQTLRTGCERPSSLDR
jgi:hypothetical protein